MPTNAALRPALRSPFLPDLRGPLAPGAMTAIQRAIAFLRSLGTNAHVWLPGANGVSVASLPSNNYLLSDGSTGYSTVDGVDGLTLDGMGSVGAEKVTNGGFATDIAGWTQVDVGAGGGIAWSAGRIAITGTSVANYSSARQTLSLTVDKTYLITFTVSGINAFVDATGPVPFANYPVGTHTMYVVAGAAQTLSFAPIGGVGTVYVDNISVKEYTGTHLTQATTANKPLVRRGMLNELLNSATPATQSVTCIAAPYTLALYGTGNVVLSGTGAGTLTGTGASDLVVLNFTPTAGSVTFTKAGTVSSFGLFKGTWTAAQILAEGGLSTTVGTAASNASAGKYWWSFDGSNDSLLSGNLGITNACTIVVAGRVNALTDQMPFAEDTNGVQIYLDTLGRILFSKTGVADILISSNGEIVAGVPFVITVRLSAGTAVIRKNGVQIATTATAYTFSATTGARIGTHFGGAAYPTNGAIGWVVPIAAALSDADCLTVERLVGSQFPGMSTVDGDANSMLLEDGSGFLTMETGDLLLLE